MSEVKRTMDPALRRRLDVLKRDAIGAVKIAIEALSFVASVTESVPYLGAFSTALNELLKICNEVETLKSEWKTIAGTTRDIKTIIDKVHEKCMSNNLNLPAGMVEPLEELERVTVQALETLVRCRVQSKRFRDRAKTFLGRGDLLESVKKCQAGMNNALNLFMVKLQIDQSFNLDAMMARLVEIQVRTAIALESTTAITGVVSLPAKPAIFHGREHEIGHVVDLLVNKLPSRVAILGPGGIGKTSIALTVMHHPEVDTLYGERRFFLSCETVNGADGLVQELLKTFGVAVEQGRLPRDALLAHMRTLSNLLLCLDNLETPWDQDRSDVEKLLALIAAIPHLVLLVTTRGADRPLQVAWTRPFLPQIQPLSLAAALETWDDICDSRGEFAVQLIEAVDRVPLAVTLLAHLAQSESPETLWQRWETEHTDLVRGHGPDDDRLNSVDISVKLSLDGPRLRSDEATLQFFSVMCILPQGIPLPRIPAFVKAYAEHFPNMRRSITLLKQCALVFESEDGFLRVLSPVRHYIQTHHPIVTTPLFLRLASIYQDLVSEGPDSSDWSAQAAYARTSIQPELANIVAVSQLCLTSLKSNRQGNADNLRSLGDLCMALYRDVEAENALIAAQTLYDEMGSQSGKAHCLRSLGNLYFRRIQHEKAERALLSAQNLYDEIDHRSGKADCLRFLGNIYLQLERLEEAERALSSAQNLYGEIDDQLGKATSMHTLGGLYVRLGRLDEAEEALTSAQNLYSVNGNRLGQANCLGSLGDLWMQFGQLEEAAWALSIAQALFDETGNQLGKANCLLTLGSLYMRLDQLDEAERALSSAQTLYEATSNRLGQANSLLSLSDVYMKLGRLDETERALLSAQSLYDAIYSRPGKANTLLFLGRLRRQLRQYDEALVLLETAQRLSRDLAYLWGEEEAGRQIELVHAESADLASRSS